MSKNEDADRDIELLAQCRSRSLQLLHANLTPAGVLAASVTARARKRGYLAIFGRDASLCAIGMALSGDRVLARGAVAGLATLAEHQAPNGQIPNIVDVERSRADFWYVGCIDATLWWLIALALVDRLRASGALRRRFARAAGRALDWLRCQEHPYFRLLQQNEASDWADIMPRSGFVLYTNALWHLVKRLYAQEGARETREHAARLLLPFGAAEHEERRTRILTAFPLHGAQDRGMYLSFLNLGSFGDEGDAFGNALAVLCGLAQGDRATSVLRALCNAGCDAPFPLRVVCTPIAARSRAWRHYMNRHRQNAAWQYHNGGIWPFAGGLWVTALAESGEQAAAQAGLIGLARANALDDWAFNEWLHGRTGEPGGMRGQSWNAATFLIAHRAVHAGMPLFRDAGANTETVDDGGATS